MEASWSSSLETNFLAYLPKQASYKKLNFIFMNCSGEANEGLQDGGFQLFRI